MLLLIHLITDSRLKITRLSVRKIKKIPKWVSMKRSACHTEILGQQLQGTPNDRDSHNYIIRG